MTLPLIQRDPLGTIAHLAKPLPCLGDTSGVVSIPQFLSHVRSLAAQLPDADHLVNLCGNRYLFMVSFCAALLRRQVNLLPPNYNPATQLALCERHDRCYVLHDGIATGAGLDSLDLSGLKLADDQGGAAVPQLAGDQLAAISFTSGSTGQSKPSLKPWSTKFEGARVNRRYMLPGYSDSPASMLATVPAQHMWGLETSVMLALMAELCVSDQRPLYPADIRDLLDQMAAPRIMVSTPVHLRAMVMSGLTFPRVERILCATAPLDPEMALQVERCFGGTLCEIYGCSEVGSMAWRRTSKGGSWQLFDAMRLAPEETGTVASADHVPGQVQMQDLIELHGEGRFSLMGRQSDLIDIAGKRGSLNELNQMLSSMTGLIDGVVFMPPQARTVPRLAAMVVLESGVTDHDVIEHFRLHLDSAFVPRRVVVVARLPRADSGKLPLDQVLALYEKTRNADASG